ncbi:hypothetical protein AB0O87_01910 [Microbacterium sp. NPDC076768]|uniref:hypothetical protein n=1 Tax=Microbacterium sp. NPDC076768 TaxID=3154858 RepID=UPI00341288D5
MGALDDGERLTASDAASWRRNLAPRSAQWFFPRRPGSGWAAANKARLASLASLAADGLLAPAKIVADTAEGRRP